MRYRGFLFARIAVLLAACGLLSQATFAEIPASEAPVPPNTVPFMADLHDMPRDLAAMKAQKIPMLLFFHASYCGYCQWVDENFIQPMQRDPAYQGKLIVRRVEIDAEGVILDRNGKKETVAHFAHRMGVHLVPVIAFFGPDGHEVGDPIDGVTVQSFYPFYLQQGIDLAEACAKTPDPRKCTPTRKKDQRSL